MYENPDRRVYVFPLYDYGGSAGARSDVVRGPKGKKGTLIDYGVCSVQETFAGTTPATISVGNASNADAYGEELSLGTTVTTALGAYGVGQLYGDKPGDPTLKAARDALILNEGALPADTSIYVVSTEAATGPAGQACPFVVIDWDW